MPPSRGRTMNITGTASSALTAASVPRLGVSPPSASAEHISNRSAPPAAAARASSSEETMTSSRILAIRGHAHPLQSADDQLQVGPRALRQEVHLPRADRHREEGREHGLAAER